METKILGTGCAKCRAMFQLTEQAVNELRLEASVVKEEDILKIISYKVLGLPALVVDGEVVSAGHDLTKEEIKVLIAK